MIDFSEYTYPGLKAYASSIGVSAVGTRDELEARIRAHFEKTQAESEQNAGLVTDPEQVSKELSGFGAGGMLERAKYEKMARDLQDILDAESARWGTDYNAKAVLTDCSDGSVTIDFVGGPRKRWSVSVNGNWKDMQNSAKLFVSRTASETGKTRVDAAAVW